ncbi:P-loop NTPase family protein [Catalinimonas niigatensis]|uniref:DnaB-like helicase C-terminal domain-containing protein n=1 Tax=Catalinimonas niigatensis TaxID=1397264 RepID=UPI002666252F|nr:DnaB-like helicase C-terminal domain-containing protein [Catalinimonas niigatensis]WPP49662.1 DnaB-like helicase C-terminal domain-containing protein [Catalinimonas niigatensis]
MPDQSLVVAKTVTPATQSNPTVLPGFQSVDQLKKSENTFKLKGDIGKLLGDLEKYMLALTIEGDQGAGKTRFTYQLANAFAGSGFNVGVFSLEMGDKSDVVRKMINSYITKHNRSRVQLTGEASEGIDTIRKHAKDFDVVIIDSWNKLDADSSEFDKLRKDFPDTIWIVIFQRTVKGTIRGGTAPLYDAGINLEAVKSDQGFEYNFVQATKNRYGETFVPYSMASKKIIRTIKLENNDTAVPA